MTRHTNSFFIPNSFSHIKQTWLLLLGLSIKKKYIYIYTLHCSAPCEFLSDINVHLLTFLLSPNIKNMRMMWRGCETPVGFKCKGAKTLLASSPHRLTRKVTSGFLWQDTTKQNGLMNFLIQSTTTILTKRKRFNSYILHILIFLHCCFIKWTQQKALRTQQCGWHFAFRCLKCKAALHWFALKTNL